MGESIETSVSAIPIGLVPGVHVGFRLQPGSGRTAND
jgi:hypothetical protein